MQARDCRLRSYKYKAAIWTVCTPLTAAHIFSGAATSDILDGLTLSRAPAAEAEVVTSLT